jgi:NAD(P)-dependent dehydrogenase (short-subunit alcohol dehydrogenase family)
MLQKFSLKDKVVVITGGLGLLGRQHALAVGEAGGFSYLLDMDDASYPEVKDELSSHSCEHSYIHVDITCRDKIESVLEMILKQHHQADVLINNAALNPKFDKVVDSQSQSRLEHYSIDLFNKEVSVGLTGSLICSQVFGKHMADRKGGVILNICSDLGVVAPDQRLYKSEGCADDKNPVKPVSYSIIKHGLVGLTRYIATYWAQKGVRCNALLPGGVYENQSEEFVEKLTNLIPMGRMANKDEYHGAIQFLISDASKYMNGSLLVMDGGRTCW